VEIKQNIIILICIFICGCTSNPFWDDQPTKKLTISGTVIAEDRETDVPVYIWVEDLDISGHTNSDSEFSIDISGLETADGSFSGEVRVFYYIHNYKVEYSVLSITEGRFSSNQNDFDEDGMLNQQIVLEKLASFNVSCDDSWNRSLEDSIRIRMEIKVRDHNISMLTGLKSVGQDYVPAGIMFYQSALEDFYFDQNNVGFISQSHFSSGTSVELLYWLGNGDISAPAGMYIIRPWFFIIQDDVPDGLYQSLGLFDVSSINFDNLRLPLDVSKRSISLQ
tara:strand:+ start:148 stop:984 length:837 start_codon:yes stop_codon:yes gene_type:complete